MLEKKEKNFLCKSNMEILRNKEKNPFRELNAFEERQKCLETDLRRIFVECSTATQYNKQEPRGKNSKRSHHFLDET